MNYDIQKALLPDEELLWSARPEDFTFMDKTNARYIRTGLILKLVGTLAVVALYWSSIVRSGNPVNGLIVAIMLAVLVFMVVAPWSTARKLRRKTWYAVTTKRLMISFGDVIGVPYESIREIAFRTDDDGHTSLLVGHEAGRLKPCKWRNATPVNPYYDGETRMCESMVFYALPESDKVRELLKPHFPQL